MPERRLGVPRWKAPDCSLKMKILCSWLSTLCFSLKVMPYNLSCFISKHMLNAFLLSYILITKMKCSGRLKKEFPISLLFMHEWQLWNVRCLSKQCASVQLQGEREKKAAIWGTVWHLSLPGLISCEGLWETRLLYLLPLEYFSNKDFLRSQEKHKN